MAQTKKKIPTKTRTTTKRSTKQMAKKEGVFQKKQSKSKKQYQQPQGLFETWKKVIFEPMEFFGNLAKSQGYKEPTTFFTVMLAINFGILAVFTLLITGILTAVGIIPTKWWAIGVVIGLFGLVLLLACSILFLFIGVGIAHILVMILGGKEDYLETFKALAYASAPMVFMVIPLLGSVAALFMIVLQVMGLHKLQKMPVIRAVLVWLIPFLFFGIIYTMIYISLFFLGI